jgi:hypothetical protein
MKRQLLAVAAIVAAFSVSRATAAPTMDGSKDAEYGAALSVQNTNTQFGNATNGDPVNGGGGSEIDAVYARITGGRLYILVTGNLETNFNKMDFFIDSKAGGINQINSATLGPTSGADPDQDPKHVHNNGMLPGGVDPFSVDQPNGGFAPPDGPNTENNGALQRMNGLTFDAGFNADYYLTVTHGFEGNIGGSGIQAYAATAHYAELGNGAAGASHALGMQLAPKGLPNVLRGTTADFNVDGDVDGGDFLTWQRGFGLLNADNPNRLVGNADGDDNPDPSMTNQDVDNADLSIWSSKYGFTAASSSLTDNFFAPQTQGIDNSNVLIGPGLPDLERGQLIDATWVNAHPTFAAPEVKFALPVVTPGNPENHRNMLNTIGLEMAIDNSNTAGVSGDAGPAQYSTPTTENPSLVNTGVELSIPLLSLGNPASTSQIKLMVFINGGNHAFLSNQFGGDGLLDVNWGGDEFGAFLGDLHLNDMNDAPGNQYVTISVPSTASGSTVPEPAAAALAVVAALACLGRRRRQL